jgi:O-antigen/teichoic acid export membrane protein
MPGRQCVVLSRLRVTEIPPPDHASSEAEAKALRRRARLSVVLLGARSVLQQLVILCANVYLARLLTPGDYGIFAVVQFALSLFAIFGDVGFGPALIQKKELPTQRELSTVWWFQVGLSSLLVVLVFSLAPWVLGFWHDLPPGTDWLLRGLSLNFLFTVLRVVPSLRLERSLRFGWISALEVLQTIAFYGTAVVMAHLGGGPASFVSASVVQAAMTALVLNLLSPWRPSLVFDRAVLRSILRFGVAFQGKNMAGFANASVTPLIAGSLLGKQALGLINFAQNIAYFPLQLVTIVSRVSFPVLSRLQGNRRALAEEIESSMRLASMGTHFFVGLCLGLGPAIVGIIYSAKWLPAVPLLYVYAAAISIGFASPVLIAALDASGRPDVGLKLSIGWTILNWAAVLIGTSLVRTELGFVVAYSVHVVVGNLAIWYVLGRMLPEARIGRGMRGSLAGASAVALVGRFALPLVASPVALVLAVPAAAVIFLGIGGLLDREMLAAIRRLWMRRKAAQVA